MPCLRARKRKDLPVEQDLGQLEEFVADFNTGWPMASFNHTNTLLYVGSRLPPVSWENSLIPERTAIHPRLSG